MDNLIIMIKIIINNLGLNNKLIAGEARDEAIGICFAYAAANGFNINLNIN